MDIMAKELETVYDGVEDLLKDAPPHMLEFLMKEQKKEIPIVIQMLVVALLEKNGEVYGYEIMRLAEHIGIGTKMSASRVYPLLHKMEKDGYIKGRWEKKKKVYSITPKGKKMAEWTKKGLKSLVTINTRFMKLLFNEGVKK